MAKKKEKEKKTPRKVYRKGVQTTYGALKALRNYKQLPHHSQLEKTIIANKKVNRGELIELLQLSVTHDLHGGADTAGSEKFEHEYLRCMTTKDGEFETRVNYINKLVEYGRNVQVDFDKHATDLIRNEGGVVVALSDTCVKKWKHAKKEAEQVRHTVLEHLKEHDNLADTRVTFQPQIEASRQKIIEYGTYLTSLYHRG